MSKRDERLERWVVEALEANGGKAKLIVVARHIWSMHHEEIAQSGDLFYTWQYDFRWAAEALRKKGIMADAGSSKRGVWELRN